MPACPQRASVNLAALFALLVTLGGCASLLPQVPRVPSFAIADAEHTTLGRVLTAQAAEHPGLSGFQVLATGHSAFAARAALADAAERSLDLQYYSADDDLSTDLLLLRLLAAAQRGVRVRILLDDIYPPSRRFAQRASALHPNVQARLFNPFFFGGTAGLGRLAEYVFDSERLNRRMHNKLWVADNAAAIVGSRNLGDEYFDVHQSANFADVDLLIAGPIVNQLSQAFDTYWNSAAAVPLPVIISA
ncbi:MAG: phospholipase D-like domain-containing protein, partial [Burkholderiaceae bacterium]